MTSAETSEIAVVVERILSWPVPMRIALARRILETVQDTAVTTSLPSLPRGYSAAEVRALLKIDKPGPDDATVKRWIEEHRREKYGP